ncbi:hypothetical protein [Acinetobacter courvalinii]|uniref:hypothetical protein n=1 Tax=Acinetobacter courvalinii TaxID=280147 RepID=UPI0019005F5A|nr:hypothetical protein [Acinetobacter courvalinii]MBJ9957402.1 hypothetical protein [Acinetobacter courvalinii]
MLIHPPDLPNIFLLDCPVNPTGFTLPFLDLATAAKKAQNLLLFFIYLGIDYE